MGEGKKLDVHRAIDTHASGSIGCAEFRAPEIPRTGWTEDADIFAFGMISCRILEIRAHYNPAIPPKGMREKFQLAEDEITMPTKLSTIFKDCLGVASRRPTVNELANRMDALYSVFLDDPPARDVDWTDWDWRQVRANARRQVGESLTEDLSDLSLLSD